MFYSAAVVAVEAVAAVLVAARRCGDSCGGDCTEKTRHRRAGRGFVSRVIALAGTSHRVDAECARANRQEGTRFHPLFSPHYPEYAPREPTAAANRYRRIRGAGARLSEKKKK